ncbi:17039_t:CDS:2, partial [Cetraspora pellucida]
DELDEFEESGPSFLYCGEFYPDNLYDMYQDKSHPDESYQDDSHQDKSCSNELPSQATYNETSKNDG